MLTLTNPAHRLIRTAAAVATVDGAATLERTFGPAFWAGWLYSQLLMTGATMLVLLSAYRLDLPRRRELALVAGAAVPWLAQLLFLLRVVPIEPEVFFAVAGPAFVDAAPSGRGGDRPAPVGGADGRPP